MRVTSIALFAMLAVASNASASQYRIQTSAGEKVVHTRLAPVVVHRVFPPFLGMHVYEASRVAREATANGNVAREQGQNADQ